jgi:hypothetical protein
MIFSPNRLDAIRSAFASRASKLTRAQRHYLSNQDFIKAFIAPEHLPILKTTEEICGLIGNNGGVSTMLAIPDTNIKVRLYLSFYRSKPPIITPQYVTNGPLEPDNFGVQGVVTWLTERVRQGLLLGDAFEALSYLNNTCSDARAFRAVFPAIAVLVNDCARSDDPKDPMRKLAARIQNNQEVRTLPRLPREAMQRLISASDLINATTLLEEQEVSPPKDHMSCDLSGDIQIPRPSIVPGGGTIYKVL